MQLCYLKTFPMHLERIGGKPTFFVEKITRHYMEKGIFPGEMIPDCFDFKFILCCKPKLHTIRRDSANEFRPGQSITHVINHHLSKKSFAPDDMVVSNQCIEILHVDDDKHVFIDDTRLLTDNEVFQLAINDGFESVKDFFAFFYENFKGKVVHWTDLKY